LKERTTACFSCHLGDAPVPPVSWATLGEAPAPGPTVDGGGDESCEGGVPPRLLATLGAAVLPGLGGASGGLMADCGWLPRSFATLGAAAAPGGVVELGCGALCANAAPAVRQNVAAATRNPMLRIFVLFSVETP